MTKLCFVLGSGMYPRVTGGMEVFNYYFIRSLKETFDIYCFANGKFDYTGVKYIKSFSIRPIKYLSPVQLFFQLLFRPKLKKVVISYSSAHAVLWKMTRATCKILGRKYYVIIHFGDLPPQKSEKVYYNFFHDAECVVAVSEDIKKNYDKKFGLDCRVIYPLVPFEETTKTKEELRTQYDIPQDANVVCIVGTIKKMKNPDTVVDAVRLLTEAERAEFKPHIVFAGGGPMLEQLREKVAACGLSDYVTFLGYVPKNKVCEVLKMSDTYLIASDFEGTSVSLLEAMANKMPIISSRAPGIVNTVKEGSECLMFTTKNAEGLKDCLLDYWKDKELSEHMSANAYLHYLNEYNYTKVIESYTHIFNC